MTKREEKQAKRIAHAIVELVERADGPVTFAQIEREIPGFKSNGDSGWEYAFDWSNGTETVIWDAMTKAGLAALKMVVSKRKVAVQRVSVAIYLLEERVLENEYWMPLVLLPARGANMDTPHWLMRCSPSSLKELASMTELEGRYRLLSPSPLRFTADQFSL
jgi:hypothetical protein